MDSDYRNLEELEKKYEEILEQNPRSNTFVMLAEVLIKRKKFKRAIEVLNRGLTTNRNNITARFLLGRIYYENWMIDQAKKHFEFILSVSPDNLASVNYLVEIYRSEGKLEKALGITQNALFYFPDNSDVTVMKEAIQKEITNVDTASAHESGNREPGSDDATDQEVAVASGTLADLYLKQGHYNECIKICDKLLLKNYDPGIVEKKNRAIKLLFSSGKSGS